MARLSLLSVFPRALPRPPSVGRSVAPVRPGRGKAEISQRMYMYHVSVDISPWLRVLIAFFVPQPPVFCRGLTLKYISVHIGDISMSPLRNRYYTCIYAYVCRYVVVYIPRSAPPPLFLSASLFFNLWVWSCDICYPYISPSICTHWQRRSPRFSFLAAVPGSVVAPRKFCS